jgi:hypothetical protein
MLLPEEMLPVNSLYFNGAYVLQALRDLRKTSLMDLYLDSRNLHQMQMPIFVLTLDWLFLAGFVTMTDGGDLELCS